MNFYLEMVSSKLFPALTMKSCASLCLMLKMSLALTLTRASPACRPAASAGLPPFTCNTNKYKFSRKSNKQLSTIEYIIIVQKVDVFEVVLRHERNLELKKQRASDLTCHPALTMSLRRNGKNVYDLKAKVENYVKWVKRDKLLFIYVSFVNLVVCRGGVFYQNFDCAQYAGLACININCTR